MTYGLPTVQYDVDPKVVASPAQVEALLAAVTAIRPDLVTDAGLPFSFAASFPCLAIGGATYALGRFGR